jgi:hypothetical protein
MSARIALDGDVRELGGEIGDVDPGDEHPRGVGLTHPQEEPGALRDPVGGIDPIGCWRAGEECVAQRDMQPA